MVGAEHQHTLTMTIHDWQVQPAEDGYTPVELATSRGSLSLRYYPAPHSVGAVICVGGVGGGWDSPAQGLYPRLCTELPSLGIAGLRVRYRHPTVLEEAALDVLAGLNFLESEGIRAAGLVGHSFGGAVVIQAAVHAPLVRTVVCLSTQSFGTEQAGALAAPCSLLLVHGGTDEVLPPSCSRYVYRLAKEPKRLVIYEGDNHGLDRYAEQLHTLVKGWLTGELAAAPG